MASSKWIIEFVNGSTKEFSALEYEVKPSRQDGSKLYVFKRNNYGPDDVHRTFVTAQVIGWWQE